MATTIWLDRESHDRLVDLKPHFGVSSIGGVIRALLDQPVPSAHQIYERRKEEVDAACRRHGVLWLVAFGSRARGDARPGSDLDVAMQLPDDRGLREFVHAQRNIEQAFACPTDLIDWPTHRPRLMADIERDGVVLYEQG